MSGICEIAFLYKGKVQRIDAKDEGEDIWECISAYDYRHGTHLWEALDTEDIIAIGEMAKQYPLFTEEE
jgi:hypothetical protein